MRESLFIKYIIDKANAYFLRLTLKRWWHVPPPSGAVAQDTHAQPDRLTSDCIRLKSPPGTGDKSERLGEEGCRVVAVEEEGWGSWVKGRKGVKSHLELYAFPSLSPIQINWIYAAIVWLKPRTPGTSPTQEVIHPQGQSTSCLPVQALQMSRPYGCTLCTRLMLFIIKQSLIILPNSKQLALTRIWKKIYNKDLTALKKTL